MRVVASAVLLTLVASSAGAFGPAAHQAVTSRAIETLPKGLKPFYKAHRLEIPSLSLDAEAAEEGPERRFPVDRLLSFPFAELPRSESATKARYGDALGPARLPWLIQESHERLVAAFRARDKEKILAESDALAGLVADLRNPLTLTDNADGQKTGQHGLFVRFSVRLPEAMGPRLKLEPDAARFLDDPQEYLFSMVKGTYVWLDNLLYEEDLARRGRSGYGELYYEALELRAGRLLRQLLTSAAQDAGSYWYTAWTQAGRPPLP